MSFIDKLNEIEIAKNNIKASLESKGKQPGNDIREYSAIINSLNGDIPSSTKVKVIIQELEPEDTAYQGFWIKSNDYTYNEIHMISKRDEKQPNSINIIKNTKRNKYKTILVESDVSGGLYWDFNEVLITDENNNVLWNIPIYYGNDTEWVDITPSDIHWIGLTIDYANNTITEIEGSYAANELLCYTNRIRCNLKNDGTVVAYYGGENYDDNGNENLQVMVEQPIVYYALQNMTISSDGKDIEKADYIIADGPMEGLSIHPAFIKDNQIYANIYLNAYEGTVINSKLSSVGDGTTQPRLCNSETLNTFRTYATNRGTVWNVNKKMAYDLEGLLILMEYKSFDFKSVLANGVFNGGTLQTVGQNYSDNLDDNGTGYCNGNKTAKLPFTYRFRENPYGNTTRAVEGLNTSANAWFYAYNNSGFQDYVGANSNYKQVSQAKSRTYRESSFARFANCGNERWLFMPGYNNSAGSMINSKCYEYDQANYRPYIQGFSYNNSDNSSGNSVLNNYFSGANLNNGSYIYSAYNANCCLMCYPPDQIIEN